MLPRWALFVRAILFPLDSFYWYMQQNRGYDLRCNAWRINGVTYSWKAFDMLANANGEIYQITRVDDQVFLKKLECAFTTGSTITS